MLTFATSPFPRGFVTRPRFYFSEIFSSRQGIVSLDYSIENIISV